MQERRNRRKVGRTHLIIGATLIVSGFLLGWTVAGQEASPSPTRVRVGTDVSEPKKIKDVKPDYPKIARDNGVEGVVVFTLVLDTAGAVKDARIERGHPLLNQAALDAVTQWQFVPTTLDGKRVEVEMTATVTFTLH